MDSGIEKFRREGEQFRAERAHHLAVHVAVNKYLDHLPLERQMRDVVMGRKNHYGSKSERGTQVAALFYSLIETAKLRGVDPAAYLLTAARAAIASPGTPLLPPRAG